MSWPHAVKKSTINCYVMLFICVTGVHVILAVLAITNFMDRFFLFNAVCLAYLTSDMLPAKFIFDNFRITAGSFLHLSYL